MSQINKYIFGSEIKPELLKQFNPDTYSKLLPYDVEGDLLFSLLLFVWRHNRIPSERGGLFNDYLFQMKKNRSCEKPIRKFISDKEYVKLFIAGVVGDKYNIPTIEIIPSKDIFKSFEFSESTIVKPTHSSGQAVMTSALPIDVTSFMWWFDIDYYQFGRELNYKDLDRKVIIEPLVFGSNNPADYKFFCFNGVPKIIQVDSDRFIQHKRDMYDSNWNLLDISFGYPRTEFGTPRPSNLTEMLDVASALSKNFDFIRVDIYSDGKSCYVGELTNVPENGCGLFDSNSSEKIFSEILFS